MVDPQALTGTSHSCEHYHWHCFHILEIRRFNQTRKTEIIMNIYDRFGSKEIVEAINRVCAAKFENLEDYKRNTGLTTSLK